jgi:sRNA-binding carbon storage regulator CsrA
MTNTKDGWLVVALKVGEAVRIGPDVCVAVCRSGKTPRLAIIAPEVTSILRQELIDNGRATEQDLTQARREVPT